VARYLPRDMARCVSDALSTMPVVVLTGMRQVGKTTMIERDPALAGRRYLTLDDFETLEAARSDPRALVQGPEPVTIDEVQREPDLLVAIKREVDRERRPGRFLLSGSANLLLLSGVSESLAGRAVHLELGPMTSRELGLAPPRSEPFLVELLRTGKCPTAGPIDRIGSDRVRMGGMPPVVAGSAGPGIWFRGFVQTYLERDCRSLAQVADIVDFQRVLRLVAARTGNLLNASDLARDARLSAATVSRYLGVLEASFSVWRLLPFLASRTSRLTKSPKLFLADAGLAAHLAGPSVNPAAADPFAGALLETWVAQHLRATLCAWCPDARLWFWNVQGRHEVDFVVESGGRTLAIEVKRGSRWSGDDLAGLRRFRETTPSCCAALLAANVESVVSLGDGIHAVPIAALVS